MTRLKELSFGFLAGNGLAQTVRLAARAEELGFGTLWIAEDYFYGGAFATATACAAVTSRIRIGIGVINPYTRHPALTAMEAGALDAASAGRLVLGVGASNRRWMQEMMGIPFVQPVPAMREMITIIRRMLAGERLTYQGKLFQVNNVHLEFEPYRKEIPIHLGVKGEDTLALAGRLADGVLLSILSSPPYCRWAIERIRVGATRAGRTLESFETAAYLLVSADHDRMVARARVQPVIAKYLGLHGEHTIMLRAGLSPAEIRPFREAFLKGQSHSAAHLVDDRLIDLFSAAGTPAECAAALQRWVEAGIDRICAFEIPGYPTEAQLEIIAREVAPLIL